LGGSRFGAGRKKGTGVVGEGVECLVGGLERRKIAAGQGTKTGSVEGRRIERKDRTKMAVDAEGLEEEGGGSES
jgi:hypothetical protein